MSPVVFPTCWTSHRKNWDIKSTHNSQQIPRSATVFGKNCNEVMAKTTDFSPSFADFFLSNLDLRGGLWPQTCCHAPLQGSVGANGQNTAELSISPVRHRISSCFFLPCWWKPMTQTVSFCLIAFSDHFLGPVDLVGFEWFYRGARHLRWACNITNWYKLHADTLL